MRRHIHRWQLIRHNPNTWICKISGCYQKKVDIPVISKRKSPFDKIVKIFIIRGDSREIAESKARELLKS